MADTITVKFKIMEDGTLQAIANDAEKAAKSTDKAAKSSDNFSKKNKGVAQAGMNSTKAFSKMTTGITGGLVPAYATLAANVFALSAAFNFFKRAADVKILEEGQISFAANTGLALSNVTKELREASGGMLGFREAAEAAAIGVAKGFSPKQLNDLADGARRASAALGRNFEDSFDRLIRGASKAEPELLDELGITLRLETATKKYGEAIGKNAKQLTAFERSQAVLIETQRQLNDMYGDMDGAVNPFVRLGKTFEDLIKAGTNFLMPLFEGLATIISNSAISAVAVFGALGMSIAKTMIPMDELKQGISDFEMSSQESLAHAINDQMNYQAELQKTKEAIERTKVQSVSESAQKIGGPSKLVDKASKGQLTDPKQIGQLKAHLKKAEREFKIHGKVRSGIFKGVALEEIQTLKASLMKMSVDDKTFLQKRKMGFKSLVLSAKSAFARIKTAGVSAFSGIGRAAITMGGAMNKVLRFAGAIGMFMMLLEIGKKLMQSPFDIVMAILKGVDFVVKASLKGFGMLSDATGNLFNAVINGLTSAVQTMLRGALVGIGKYIDFVSNMWAGVYNAIVTGVNFVASYVGLENPIKTLNDESTAAADLMRDLGNETINFSTSLDTASTSSTDAMENLADGITGSAEAFKNSGFGIAIKGFQDRRIAAANEAQAYDELKDKIRGVGTELNTITQGLSRQKGAKRETSAATALSSLNISGALSAANETKDPEKRANALKLLRTQFAELEKISPKAYKALQGDPEAMSGVFKTLLEDGKKVQVQLTNLEALENIETSAQAATGGLAALKDGINNVGSAISSGDLLGAEQALEALQGTANTTSDSFKALFGDDTEAGKKALADFEASFSNANMTAGEFLDTIRNLRIENDALAVSMAKQAMIGGTFAETFKLQNDLQKANLAVRLKQAEIDKAGENDKTKLKQEKALLEVARQNAAIALARNNMGSSMSAIQSSKDLKGEGMQAQLSPMLGELAKLGPEGEMIQTVVNGAFAIQDAFSTAFEKMNADGATTGTKIQAGLEVAATAMHQIGGMLAASSKQRIAGIDAEIAAEKKRDGSSAASVAKIAQLEKKKEQAQRKAFEQNKTMKMAQTIISTAAGIMHFMSEGNVPMAVATGVLGAAQLAIISSTSFQGGGAKAPEGPSKIAIGNRKNSVDMARGRSPSGELSYARGERGTGTGMTNFRPTGAFAGYKHRAGGGYIVGEQGPEVFMPEVPGEIIASGQGTGGTTNVNFSINAVDAAGVEDLLMSQRGNIISMIRESANESGELFLENVNTGAIPNEGEIR